MVASAARAIADAGWVAAIDRGNTSSPRLMVRLEDGQYITEAKPIEEPWMKGIRKALLNFSIHNQ